MGPGHQRALIKQRNSAVQDRLTLRGQLGNEVGTQAGVELVGQERDRSVACQYFPPQATAARYMANRSPGNGVCSSQVIWIGRSERCSTYRAVPAQKYGIVRPDSVVFANRTKSATLVPSRSWLMYR